MQKLKYILFASLLTFSCFFIITYSSCAKKSCKDITCLNGGNCNGGYCVCVNGYTGGRCEIEPCASITCLNGGICKDAKCQCPAGYEGDHCEILLRDKFIGYYWGTEHCGGSDSSQYTVTLTPGQGNTTLMYNSSRYFSNSTFSCTFIGKDSFKFNLPWGGSSIGILNGGTLTTVLNYPGGTCTFVGPRQ